MKNCRTCHRTFSVLSCRFMVDHFEISDSRHPRQACTTNLENGSRLNMGLKLVGQRCRKSTLAFRCLSLPKSESQALRTSNVRTNVAVRAPEAVARVKLTTQWDPSDSAQAHKRTSEWAKLRRDDHTSCQQETLILKRDKTALRSGATWPQKLKRHVPLDQLSKCAIAPAMRSGGSFLPFLSFFWPA